MLYPAIMSRFTLRAVAVMQMAISIFSLAAAYTAQYGFNLQPCILCLYQRVPFAVVIALSIIGLFVPVRAARALVALSGAVFLAGAAIAFFHVGVEQHWWVGTASCGTSLHSGSLEYLREQIMTAPVVKCDTPAWTLFGISMAGYNLAMSLGLALASFYAALVVGQKKPS